MVIDINAYPSNKIYIGTLTYIEFYKELNPNLIYFICYQAECQNYSLNSRIIPNLEPACETLSDFDIIYYNPPKKRKSHKVTRMDCYLTSFGRRVAKELLENGVCQNMQAHLNFDNVEAFNHSFHELFDFGFDPIDILSRLIQDIKQKFDISLPPNNHRLEKEGVLILFTYSPENNRLLVKIHIECSCSARSFHEISQETLIKHNKSNDYYTMNCHSEKCCLNYIIAPDLRYLNLFRSIE